MNIFWVVFLITKMENKPLFRFDQNIGLWLKGLLLKGVKMVKTGLILLLKSATKGLHLLAEIIEGKAEEEKDSASTKVQDKLVSQIIQDESISQKVQGESISQIIQGESISQVEVKDKKVNAMINEEEFEIIEDKLRKSYEIKDNEIYCWHDPVLLEESFLKIDLLVEHITLKEPERMKDSRFKCNIIYSLYTEDEIKNIGNRGKKQKVISSSFLVQKQVTRKMRESIKKGLVEFVNRRTEFYVEDFVKMSIKVWLIY